VSLSEKTGQYQKIEVGRLPSSFYSIKAVRKGMTFAEVGVRFFFEISPYHDSGLASGLKWPKFWATLGEPKRYFVQIAGTLISVQ